MLQACICPICGGNIVKKNVDGTTMYECRHCGRRFEVNNVDQYTDQLLRAQLDEEKLEKVGKLKNLLDEEVGRTYIDSERILEICRDIRRILPDDFLATFFEAANSHDMETTGNMLRNFDVRKYGFAVDTVLDFMLKSFEPEYHLPLGNLIEMAYKNTDLTKHERYSTLLSQEAKKMDAGIYTPNVPRDVFVCYSSKDMPKVMELVSYLEDEGISCFVAARNLKHGVDAVQNYQTAIYTAIEYCKIIVFVSSTSSRKLSCDAIRFELPYVRKGDVANAPAQYKHDYEKMPAQYKKPRVEYLLNDYTESAAETTAKEFFAGNEWCKSPKSVARRVTDILTNGWATADESVPQPASAQPSVDIDKIVAATIAKTMEQQAKEEAARKEKEESERREREAAELKAMAARRAQEAAERRREEERRAREEAERKAQAAASVTTTQPTTQSYSYTDTYSKREKFLFFKFDSSRIKNMGSAKRLSVATLICFVLTMAFYLIGGIGSTKTGLIVMATVALILTMILSFVLAIKVFGARGILITIVAYITYLGIPIFIVGLPLKVLSLKRRY